MKKSILCSVALTVGSVGCSFSGDSEGPLGNGGVPVFREAPVGETLALGTQVNGFVWDPELFFTSLAECGPTCPAPPLQMPGIPHLEKSLVKDVQVTLFDTVAGAPTLPATAPTSATGFWVVPNVATRAEPYLPFSVLGPSAAEPGAYLPTLTLRPVIPGARECYDIGVLQASSAGALDAVARWMTANAGMGTVTAADFLDPTKFGGVAVWWLFAAADSIVRAPANATQLTASGGTTYAITWAPVGALPPGLSALQSPRGFFVESEGGPSSLGLSVTVFPPLMGPPSPVQFTAEDTITDEAQLRPWAFRPLPPLVIAPGVISYGELQASVPSTAPAAPPPGWLCLGGG